jgi:hypothetical protein
VDGGKVDVERQSPDMPLRSPQPARPTAPAGRAGRRDGGGLNSPRYTDRLCSAPSIPVSALCLSTDGSRTSFSLLHRDSCRSFARRLPRGLHSSARHSSARGSSSLLQASVSRCSPAALCATPAVVARLAGPINRFVPMRQVRPGQKPRASRRRRLRRPPTPSSTPQPAQLRPTTRPSSMSDPSQRRSAFSSASAGNHG